MARASAGPVEFLLRQTERLAVERLSDEDLLRAFSARRDECCYQALLSRHGPMVLGVCRAVLANEADAEDAFQATFLVLARKAGSIRIAGSVASWLHGVAYRIAVKARTAFARRRKYEERVPVREWTAPDELAADELRVLHEELDRLGERYRAPLVLCYLQGRTQAEAAHLLGLPKGTLKGRLERGRTLLRDRLTRRGVAPALVAATSLPAALAPETTKAAVQWINGNAAAVSPEVAALAQGVLKAMRFNGWKLAVLATALMGVMGLVYGVLPGAEAQDKAPAEKRPLTRPAEEKGKPKSGDKEKLQGEWRLATLENDGLRLGEGRPELQGNKAVFSGDDLYLTDQDGRAAMTFDLNQEATPKTIRLTTDDGRVLVGIYELDGDSLKLCLAKKAGAAPKEFTAESGSKRLLYSFKRGAAKPAEPPKVKDNTPPEGIEGTVREVSKEGTLLLSIGADAGLKEGHTLEVFRLGDTPKYLGQCRVVKVESKQAVAEMVKKPTDAIKAGDHVASRIQGK